MANTYTTSKIVRLYDQRTPTKLLHPETELSAVVCTSGGLVVIADNNISVPASSVGAVISASGFIQEPILEATTGGTVTNIGTSTGYGTLLKTISTTETVRLPATSASNDYIPTELAVAVGLDRKQDVLSAGSFITLTPDGAGHDIIAVSPTTTEIRGGTSATHSALPTEKAVQLAIGVASASAVTEAMTSVGNAGYATQTWAQQHFLTSGGAHDWGYATNNAAGVVKPVANGGLVLGDNGALSVAGAPQYATYATASAGSAGIVRVTSAVVAAANATERGVTVVPTTDAVYSAIQNHISPQKPISSGSGITVTETTGSYTIELKSANATSLGGVVVPANGGLLINGGSVTVAGATTQGNYTDAAAVPYAGVRVLSSIANTTTAAYKSSGYVPSVQAVYDYVSGATASVLNVVGNTYATTTYVQNNYVQRGTGPETNWGYATGTTHGVVMVPAANGLSVTGGTLAMAQASAYDTFYGAANGSHGAVVVLNVLPPIMGSEQSTYANSPIVPNGVAVYQFAEKHQASIYTTVTYADGTTAGFGGVKVLTDTTGILDQDIDYNTSAYVLGAKATYQFVSAYVRDNAPSAAALYFGDFAVTSATGTTYNIANGTVWTDGVATGTTVGASNCTVTGNTGTIWLTITSGATFSYAVAPTFGTATTSYPIANVVGSTVVQCQLGPIVVRGRWA